MTNGRTATATPPRAPLCPDANAVVLALRAGEPQAARHVTQCGNCQHLVVALAGGILFDLAVRRTAAPVISAALPVALALLSGRFSAAPHPNEPGPEQGGIMRA